MMELEAIAKERGGIIQTTVLKTSAGNSVPAYDLERTICDCVRSRNKMGTETFLAALKLYASSPRKDLNKLNTYAKKDAGVKYPASVFGGAFVSNAMSLKAKMC